MLALRLPRLPRLRLGLDLIDAHLPGVAQGDQSAGDGQTGGLPFGSVRLAAGRQPDQQTQHGGLVAEARLEGDRTGGVALLPLHVPDYRDSVLEVQLLLHFQLDEDLGERPGRHLFHFDEQTLPSAVHVVALLDLPQDGGEQQQQQETPADRGLSWTGLAAKTRHSRRKSDEKLLQIQLGILRERDLYPQGRLEVVHVHVERGQSYVVFDAEVVFRLCEFGPESCAVVIYVDRLLLFGVAPADCYVHLGKNRTCYREVGVDVGFDRGVAEVYLGVVAVFFLRQVEGELVVYG
jgi:hypothetical protein